MKNDYNSSCYYNGYIYGYNVAALRCISAETGEVKWTKRGFGKGSLIIVGDKLLVLSDQGKLVLVDAVPHSYVEKGSIQAISGKSWTAPSFVNGKVFVRNLTEMACYKITISEIKQNSFVLEIMNSNDKGNTWNPGIKLTYIRKKE